MLKELENYIKSYGIEAFYHRYGKEALEELIIAVKCSGYKEGGEAFYAYSLMSVYSFVLYQEKLKNKEAFDLNDYGVIVASGKGHEPPAEVKQQMAEKYLMIDDYHQQLAELINKL